LLTKNKQTNKKNKLYDSDKDMPVWIPNGLILLTYITLGGRGRGRLYVIQMEVVF